MIVRAADPGELAEVGRLRVTAYCADGYLTPTSRYAATLRGLGSTGDGRVLVADEDGEIVGTVMLQHWPHAGQVVGGPAEAEIRALAVAPAARGKGIGRALVRAVMAEADRDGIRRLLLTHPAMKAAQRLYEAAGFRRLPERDFSPDPGETLLAYGIELPGTA